jgi:DNA modification methylase
MKPYYDHAGITIYHADCRDVLPGLEMADLLLTDPPYGIGADAKMADQAGSQPGTSAAPRRDYGRTNWDDRPVDDEVILLALGVATRCIVFGGNYYSHILAPSSCWLVWDKENGANDFADCELAWTNFPQAVRLRRHRWNGMLRKNNESRFHPTQKPLDLMKWCVSQADKHGANNTILDPFMGSGTTLRAAKDLGRRAIGIELEEKYCEIAAKRLSQECFKF